MLTAATAQPDDCRAGDMFEAAADDGRPTRIFAGGIRMSEARACSGLGQDDDAFYEVSHAANSRSNSISF